MWLLIKVLVSSIAFFIRFTNRRLKIGDEPTSLHEGVELFTNVVTTKNRTVQSTSWNRAFRCKAIFKLTRESRWDRFFKNWGMAEEIQTQDLTFDDLVYISSDSRSFMRKIQQDREARHLITSLFNRDCEWISCDGTTLKLHFRGDRRSDQESARVFARLSKQLEELQNIPREFDPFALKALITESLIWGFVAYSISSLVQWTTLHEDVYLNVNGFAKVALITTALIAIALLVLIFFLFKGSSRGHRIIIESIIVLAVATPVGGVALFSDLNIDLDRSTSDFIEVEVTGHYTQMHRRRGSSYPTYHIQIENRRPTDYTLPSEIKVSMDVYEKVNVGTALKLEIGRGKLHQPWIRNIHAP